MTKAKVYRKDFPRVSSHRESEAPRWSRWLLGSVGLALGISAQSSLANGQQAVVHPVHHPVTQHLVSGGTSTSTTANWAAATTSQATITHTAALSGTPGLGQFQSLTLAIGEKTSTVGLANQVLNLNSSKDTVSLSSLPKLSNTSINVAGKSLSVTNSTPLTQSEAVALSEVLQTGQQTIALNQHGVADGGSLTLTGFVVNQLKGLVIPTGVTLLDKISAPQTFNLTSGLTNAGNIQFTSQATQSPAVTINASAVSNSGVIGASGDLNINTSTVTNSGTIQSTHGNITIQNTSSPALNVDNTGGKIVAANAVTFSGGSASTQNNSLNVQGGLVSGSAVNFNSPGGMITVNADQISGPVNVNGGNANVHAQNGLLSINSSNLTNDPIYSSSTNLAISVSNTNGASYIAVAGGNVTLSGAPGTILTEGGAVTIGAGVKFNAGTGAITGASTTGGSIELGNVNINSAGGDVVLTADAGTTSGSGAITFGSIQTNGTVNHFNGGNVTITSANTTVVGNISTAGSNSSIGPGGAGGNVTVTESGKANLTMGTINTHGGNGSQGNVGAYGDGGIGGNGGDGFILTGGGQGGAGGASGGYQPIPVFLAANGGAGGFSDNPGGMGTLSPGSPIGNGGAGGDGGNFSTAQKAGINGDDGVTDGQPGGDGQNGFAGGPGGSVSITTGGNLKLGAVTTYGGTGGVGGFGGQGGFGAGGGGGGAGGNGTQLTLANSTGLTGANGNPGQNGGNGGNGSDGGDGGSGGAGGQGGDAGNVTIKAGGSVTFASNSVVPSINPGHPNSFYNIDAEGGTGGRGGTGGYGGSGGNGGTGGIGGNGSQAQDGGSMPSGPPTGSPLTESLIYSQPGTGGAGGNGGNGGNGGDGGATGDGGDGGAGGGGGTITITAGGAVAAGNGTPTLSNLSFSVSGGSPGQGGNAGGNAGFGGLGGGGNNLGIGGPAGAAIQVNGDPGVGSFKSKSSANHSQPGANGKNGMPGNGGNGGDSGNGGKGGDAGTNGGVVLTAPSYMLVNVDGTGFIKSGYSGLHVGDHLLVKVVALDHLRLAVRVEEMLTASPVPTALLVFPETSAVLGLQAFPARSPSPLRRHRRTPREPLIVIRHRLWCTRRCPLDPDCSPWFLAMPRAWILMECSPPTLMPA